MEAFAKSIDQPGKKEAFSVSAASKALADAVSEQAPMGAYFKALLSGDHAGAAKIAWQNAHAPGSEARYGEWLEAVGKAVLCHDQAFSNRAEAFMQWSNSSLRDAAGQLVGANPIADIVGPKPATTPLKVNPTAQTYFDKLTDLRSMQGLLTVTQQQNAGWLPSNEVLILAVHSGPDSLALPAYIWQPAAHGKARLVTVEGDAGGIAATTTTDYDDTNNVTQITDAQSKVTKYTYDDANRRLTTIYAFGTANVDLDHHLQAAGAGGHAHEAQWDRHRVQLREPWNCSRSGFTNRGWWFGTDTFTYHPNQLLKTASRGALHDQTRPVDAGHRL